MKPRAGARLRRAAAAEQRELSRSLRELGPLWATADSVVEAYGRIADSIERVAMSPEPRDTERARESASRAIVGNLFLRHAGRSGQLELLNLARRHWPEALANRRRAFELVAFAWMMWKDLEAAARWLLLPLPPPVGNEASGGGAEHGGGASSAPGLRPDLSSREWAEYRRMFSNRRIRGALRTLDERFPGIYDELAARTHPSLSSLASAQTRALSVKTGRLDRVGLFDGSRYARDGLLTSLMAEWVQDFSRGHVLLLEGFAGRAFARSEWAGPRRDASGLLESLRDRIVRDRRAHAAHEDALKRRREAARERYWARRGIEGRSTP